MKDKGGSLLKVEADGGERLHHQWQYHFSNRCESRATIDLRAETGLVLHDNQFGGLNQTPMCSGLLGHFKRRRFIQAQPI